jgi:hypothetical protein
MTIKNRGDGSFDFGLEECSWVLLFTENGEFEG